MGRPACPLARAREKLIDARRSILEGRSPAQEKQREKRCIKEAKSFGEFGERWLREARMADSTRAMRRSIFERDILPTFRNRLLTEIVAEDLRAMCAKVKARGAPATAVQVRDIVKLIYAFAILHGEKVANPAEEVGPASIATFVPKDRALSPAEIRVMLGQLEHVPTLPTIPTARGPGRRGRRPPAPSADHRLRPAQRRRPDAAPTARPTSRSRARRRTR